MKKLGRKKEKNIMEKIEENNHKIKHRKELANIHKITKNMQY